MASFDEVRSLLTAAATAFHEVRGDLARARAEQFDCHLATVAMVVEHTDDELNKEQ